DLDSQLACRVVVQEEQRLGSLNDDVVGAHRNQIYADRVVMSGIDGKSEFGAHAVRARNQHRLPVAARDLHQGAEAADSREYLGPLRAAHERLDPLDELIASVDVDTGVAVGDAAVNWRFFFHDNILPALQYRMAENELSVRDFAPVGRRPSFMGWAWLILCVLSYCAWAGRPVRVYEVDLKGGQSPAALQDAMREALVRATGRRESATDPALAN